MPAKRESPHCSWQKKNAVNALLTVCVMSPYNFLNEIKAPPHLYHQYAEGFDGCQLRLYKKRG